MACQEIICPKCNWFEFTNDTIRVCPNCSNTSLNVYFDEDGYEDASNNDKTYFEEE